MKVKLGQLELGFSEAQVQALMGPPVARDESEGNSCEFSYGESLCPRLLFKRGVVAEIVSSPAISFDERCFENGDSFRDLVELLGEPLTSSDKLKQSDSSFVWEERLPLAAMFDLGDSRLMVNVDEKSGTCVSFTLRAKAVSST